MTSDTIGPLNHYKQRVHAAVTLTDAPWIAPFATGCQTRRDTPFGWSHGRAVGGVAIHVALGSVLVPQGCRGMTPGSAPPPSTGRTSNQALSVLVFVDRPIPAIRITFDRVQQLSKWGVPCE